MSGLFRSSGAQHQAPGPEDIFRAVVMFCADHGLTDVRPAKLSKDLRAAHRAGGHRAAATKAREHVLVLARQAYLDDHLGFELMSHLGYADPVRAEVQRRVDRGPKKKAPVAPGAQNQNQTATKGTD